MREFESDIFFSFNNQEDLLDSNKRLSGKLYVSNSNDIRIEYIKLANPMDMFHALSPQASKPFVVMDKLQIIKGLLLINVIQEMKTLIYHRVVFSLLKGKYL